jgi:hypothetical protein
MNDVVEHNFGNIWGYRREFDHSKVASCRQTHRGTTTGAWQWTGNNSGAPDANQTIHKTEWINRPLHSKMARRNSFEI